MRLIHADNLEAIRSLDETPDLVYLDPPYNTGESFWMPDGRRAFDDRWPSLSGYLAELAKRLVLLHEKVADHGSIVIHVDPRVSHYVKVWCDSAWGADSFAGEVIWRYRRWPTPIRAFQRMHDVLLVYRKDPRVPGRWNQLHEPLAESTRKTWGTKRQRAVMEDGRRKRSSTTSDETPGAPLSDVWDIGILAPVAKERTGYPTQKPEALLERVILALSDPRDLVLDPYCGSGTTLAVAQRLGRRAIGIDQSAVAIEVASRRLGLEAA